MSTLACYKCGCPFWWHLACASTPSGRNARCHWPICLTCLLVLSDRDPTCKPNTSSLHAFKCFVLIPSTRLSMFSNIIQNIVCVIFPACVLPSHYDLQLGVRNLRRSLCCDAGYIYLVELMPSHLMKLCLSSPQPHSNTMAQKRHSSCGMSLCQMATSQQPTKMLRKVGSLPYFMLQCYVAGVSCILLHHTCNCDCLVVCQHLSKQISSLNDLSGADDAQYAQTALLHVCLSRILSCSVPCYYGH